MPLSPQGVMGAWIAAGMAAGVVVGLLLDLLVLGTLAGVGLGIAVGAYASRGRRGTTEAPGEDGDRP